MPLFAYEAMNSSGQEVKDEIEAGSSEEAIAKIGEEMKKLETIEKQMLASPDRQISLTGPNSRSMATSGRGSGVVGYNALK